MVLVRVIGVIGPGRRPVQLFHFVLYALQSFGIADVVSLDVRLYEQRVVDIELGIEAEGAQRG